MCRSVLLTCAALALVTGCGMDNSAESAESSLGDWLSTVERGDHNAACELLTSKYRRQVANPDCASAMAELAGRLPPANGAMDVPAWDPSGEALVEVTDPRDGTVSGFWMQHLDGQWLVAGPAT